MTALAVALSANACAAVDEATLTIENRSSSPFTGIFIAEADEEDVGPNRLPAPLMPGEDFAISGIDCDEYDLVVTTDDVRCEVRSMDICIDDRRLTLDDGDLSSCIEVAGDPTPEPTPPEPEPQPPQPEPQPPQPDPQPPEPDPTGPY